MLQQDRPPDDFVVATGETHTVREFADARVRRAGVALRGRGKGRSRAWSSTGRACHGGSRYYRPPRSSCSSATRRRLGRTRLEARPRRAKAGAMMMAGADLELVRKGA